MRLSLRRPAASRGANYMFSTPPSLLAKTRAGEEPFQAAGNSWWAGVTAELLPALGAKLHPGALRYYDQAGVDIPDQLH